MASLHPQPTPPPLSTETIVEAALDLAEREGLAALSMRKLAVALESAPMSLYRHVENKDALLALMTDYALADLPEPRPDGAPVEEAMRFFTAFYDLLAARPVVTQVMVERPVTSPHLISRAERLLDCLTSQGVAEPDAVGALLTLTWFTLGAAQYATARSEMRGTERFAALDAADYPTVHRLAAHFDPGTRRDQFLTGLDHLVRGYAPR